jgi:hypothetical protein
LAALERRVAVYAVAADHEEDRHAGRPPRERERQIADDHARVERVAVSAMEALHADPDDLPAMKIGDEQRREPAHRVDHVFLVIGDGRRSQRRSAECLHAIRILATDEGDGPIVMRKNSSESIKKSRRRITVFRIVVLYRGESGFGRGAIIADFF